MKLVVAEKPSVATVKGFGQEALRKEERNRQ